MRECIATPTLSADDTPQTLILGSDDTKDTELFSSDDSPVLAAPIDVEAICPVVHSQFFRFDGSFQFNNLVLFGPN